MNRRQAGYPHILAALVVVSAMLSGYCADAWAGCSTYMHFSRRGRAMIAEAENPAFESLPHA